MEPHGLFLAGAILEAKRFQSVQRKAVSIGLFCATVHQYWKRGLWGTHPQMGQSRSACRYPSRGCPLWRFGGSAPEAIVLVVLFALVTYALSLCVLWFKGSLM